MVLFSSTLWRPTTHFLLLVTMLCSCELFAREWKSADGKFKIEAEFVAFRNGKVVLEKKNGEVITVPIDRLSKDDVAYIEEKTGTKTVKTSDSSKDDETDLFAGSDKKTEMKPSGSVNAAGEDSAEEESLQAATLIQPIKLKGEKESDPSGVARILPKPTYGIKSMTFSPDGAYLAAGLQNTALIVYDVNNAKVAMLTPELRILGVITALQFSSNGKMLLTGSEKGIVVVWMVSKTGQLQSVGQFPGHTGEIECLVVAKDNNTVISGGKDKKARIWLTEDGRELMSIDFEREVTGVWISQDGKEALATDCQTLVRIDLETQRTTTVELAKYAYGDQASFSRDGKLLAYKSSSTAKVFNTKTGKEICAVQSAITASIQSVAFSPDNRRLLTGDRGIVSVWDTADGSRIEAIPSGIDSSLDLLAFSPDNWHFAVTAGYTPVVVLRLGRK